MDRLTAFEVVKVDGEKASCLMCGHVFADGDTVTRCADDPHFYCDVDCLADAKRVYPSYISITRED